MAVLQAINYEMMWWHWLSHPTVSSEPLYVGTSLSEIYFLNVFTLLLGFEWTYNEWNFQHVHSAGTLLIAGAGLVKSSNHVCGTPLRHFQMIGTSIHVIIQMVYTLELHPQSYSPVDRGKSLVHTPVWHLVCFCFDQISLRQVVRYWCGGLSAILRPYSLVHHR